MTELYSKDGLTLPYEIERKFYKWMGEGEEKKRYEVKTVVSSAECNNFVETLANELEGLALSNVSHESRGPLTIVTATYGEGNYTEDQGIVWYTMSNGVISMHMRKWVENNPASIKAFCNSLKMGYGYSADEISVSCNPQPGEEKVMCEATFTPQNQVTDEEDNFEGSDSGNDGEEDEETIEESGTSMQMSSSMVSIPVDAVTYLNKKIGTGKGSRLMTFASRVESGEYRWIEAGTFGTDKPSKSGWFSTVQDASPMSLEPNSYLTREYTQDEVNQTIAALKSVPSVTIPQIRVTITTKVTSSNKMTMSKMGANASNAGSRTKSINEANISLSVPEGLSTAKDTEGNEYEVETEWIDEGTSFDISDISTKTSLSGKKFYVGMKTHSYSTISTIKPVKDWAEAGGGS